MKKVRNKLKKWKGVMSFSLALLIFIYTVIADWSMPVNRVYADEASDRVSNFINLAKGKQEKELEGLDDLTTDDLRFMGVYLSNFYVPFCTDLCMNAESKTLSSTKESMAGALKTNLSFSDDTANTFVENILNMSRESAQTLEMQYSKEYQKDLKELKESDGFVANKYNFIELMCGDIDGFINQFDLSTATTMSAFNSQRSTGEINYIYFGYKKDGKFVPVFDCCVGNGTTTSQVVFQQCLASLQVNLNQALNIFDFGKSDKKDINEGKVGNIIGDTNNSPDGCYSQEQAGEASMYGTKLAVDCFGNIIVMGANTQMIAVPGCMNPYTWMSLDKEGNDAGTGNNYMLMNYNALGLLSKNNLTGISVNAETGDRTATVDSRLVNAIGDYVPSVGDDLVKSVRDNAKAWIDGQEVELVCAEAKGKLIGNDYIKGNKYKREVKYKNSKEIDSKVKKALKDGKKTIKMEVVSKKDTKYFKSTTVNVPLVTEGFTTSISYSVYRGQNYKKFKNFWGDNKMGRKLEGSKVTLREVLQKSFKGFISKNDNLSESMFNAQWLNGDNTGCSLTIGAYLTNSCKILDGMFTIDNLGAYTVEDFQTLNAIRYIGDDGKLLETFKDLGEETVSGFANTYKDIKDGEITNSLGKLNEATVLNLYSTYAIACLYKDDAESKALTVGKLGYRLYIENLPTIKSSSLNFEGMSAEDKELNSIRDWIYYLLHPTKGLDYVRILLKNKTTAVLVGWHNDMLGTTNVGNTTGTTRYRSSTGYVSTPDLSEIKWTNSLINLYNKSIPFLIVVMIIIMLFAYVSGIMPFQRALFGLIMFSAFLFAPVTLINNVVGVGNNVSQRIYGDKFTYWALVQEESYADAIDTAALGGGTGSDDTSEKTDTGSDKYENYLRVLYSQNSEQNSNQGGDSIVLKWQAPKKMASLMFTKNDTKTLDALKSSKLITKVLGRDSMSGQSYMDNDESTYLYRSYTDLANFSRYIYRGISKGDQESYDKTNVTEKTDIANALSTIDQDYKSYIEEGYTNSNKDGDTSYLNALRIVKPLTSQIYRDAVSSLPEVNKMTTSNFVGINQEAFDFSIPIFTQSSVNYDNGLLPNIEDTNKEEIISLYGKYEANKEISGLASYGLMSESPFYYYSWCLYDQGMSTEEKANGNYKSLLLGQDNGGYFYNEKGNGELKDFMDMRSLFTYIIPYLKQGNDIVRAWDEVYGTEIYEGVPIEEGHWDDADIKDNSDLYRKYWHNVNVARLYEIYTPWVDLMYDCAYANPETVTVMGEKYTIEDPLNPATYPEERPMIFSESEMYDYGLTEADLTEVERRILKCNQNMEERMYELLNYYSFSDVTLNTAAAINCTFAFNTTFSSTGILSSNINLYPQSFEINDFSFDAFLRMILANTLGEDLILDTTDGTFSDFYTMVVEKSSMTTAFMYIIVDILSQFLLPAVKIFFIILVFLSAVLLIIATAFKVDPEQKFINKLIRGIGIPMLGLLGINVGFSWVISLFMGVGNNAVTQSNVLSIETGDPVIVMLIIAALDIICLMLYYKLILGVWSDIKHNFQMGKSFVAGAFGGTFAVAGGLIAKGISGTRNSSSGGSSRSGGVDNSSTGVQSPRASRRASMQSAKGMEERDTKVNDATKRETIKSGGKKKSSEDKGKKINDTIKSGNEKISGDENRAKDIVGRAKENVSHGIDNVDKFTKSMEKQATKVAEKEKIVSDTIDKSLK